MKSLGIATLIIALFQLNGESQNLVPNPSFEVDTGCPSQVTTVLTNQINKAIPWDHPTTGTSDYYNSCNDMINGIVSVPYNAVGHQSARTGIAYCGFYSYYGGGDLREYISAPLDSTLIFGQRYYSEIYVCLADTYTHASDGFGIYFSNGPVDSTGVGWDTLPYFPQISNPDGNVITDKTIWTKISGAFIAGGGENYITIGNFKSDQNTNSINVGGTFSGGYYYIDDVLLMEDTTESVNEEIGNTSSEVWAYPNPASGEFTVEILKQVQNDISMFELYDVMGRSAGNWQLTVGNNKVDVSDLTGGIYLWRFGEARGKVVVE